MPRNNPNRFGGFKPGNNRWQHDKFGEQKIMNFFLSSAILEILFICKILRNSKNFR